MRAMGRRRRKLLVKTAIEPKRKERGKNKRRSKESSEEDEVLEDATYSLHLRLEHNYAMLELDDYERVRPLIVRLQREQRPSGVV